MPIVCVSGLRYVGPTTDRSAGPLDRAVPGVCSPAVQIHRKLPASIELDDLIAYGQLGIVEAAHSYDSSRGCQFSTDAYYRIRGSIYDGVAMMTWGLCDASTESCGLPACEAAARRTGSERRALRKRAKNARGYGSVKRMPWR